jgi:DNA-directed RNA polymerase specialized sigma24 family protein
LRYRLECKPAEIAQRIGWQAQSVSVELSRARDMLRRCLQRKLGLFTG